MRFILALSAMTATVSFPVEANGPARIPIRSSTVTTSRTTTTHVASPTTVHTPRARLDVGRGIVRTPRAFIGRHTGFSQRNFDHRHHFPHHDQYRQRVLFRSFNYGTALSYVAPPTSVVEDTYQEGGETSTPPITYAPAVTYAAPPAPALAPVRAPEVAPEVAPACSCSAPRYYEPSGGCTGGGVTYAPRAPVYAPAPIYAPRVTSLCASSASYSYAPSYSPSYAPSYAPACGLSYAPGYFPRGRSFTYNQGAGSYSIQRFSVGFNSRHRGTVGRFYHR